MTTKKKRATLTKADLRRKLVEAKEKIHACHVALSFVDRRCMTCVHWDYKYGGKEYWQSNSSVTVSISEPGWCSRYPDEVDKNADNTCGEHQLLDTGTFDLRWRLEFFAKPSPEQDA